jgi:2-dehydropantoate 2-reductase
MKILVIGAGVIGTIYGYALAQAGNDVTHYVRPGKKKQLENGIKIKLLDGREKESVEKDVLYRLKVTESLSPDHDYDLILVSVRHYQMGLVLPLLKENAGKADVLFFNGLWDSFEIVDAYLPRSKYLWGFPVAGGGYHGRDLDAALLDEVHLGEVDGQRTSRIDRLRKVFNGAGLKVDVQERMQHWLWVHFAINCGIIAAAFRAGGATELLNNIPNLRRGILASRDALAVCQARGVDVSSLDDARYFNMPALLGAIAVWLRMKTNKPARKIMESHTAVDELQRMYLDLLKTGEELKVDMPHYLALRPYIDRPIPPDWPSR